jgi:NitT/TauT family transport system substrate-binding protein
LIKNRKIMFLAILCSLFSIVVFPGCSRSQPVSQRQQTIKFGILPNEEVLPLYVAQQDGYFQKRGLKVDLLLFHSAAERDAAVQAGAVDGAEGDMIAVTLLRQGGTPVKAVSLALGANNVEGRFALLAAPGSKLTLDQLKGKTLAISNNTIIEFVADELLKLNGQDSSQMKKVFVPKMPLRLEMLLQKQVDTALLPDPLATLAQLKGATVLLDDTKQSINISQSVLFFSDKTITGKRQAITDFLLAFNDGAQQATKHPDKYRNLFNDKVQIPVELQKSFPVTKFSSLQAPGRDNVNMVLSWMKGNKLLKSNLRYQDLVTSDLLPHK